MLSWNPADCSRRLITCTMLLWPKMQIVHCLNCALNYTYIDGWLMEIDMHLWVEFVLHIISIFLLPLETYWICTWSASYAKPKQMQIRVRGRDGELQSLVPRVIAKWCQRNACSVCVLIHNFVYEPPLLYVSVETACLSTYATLRVSRYQQW